MKDWIPKVVRLDLIDMVPMQGYSCESRCLSYCISVWGAAAQ